MPKSGVCVGLPGRNQAIRRNECMGFAAACPPSGSGWKKANVTTAADAHPWAGRTRSR
jgi:hypothetical protein